MSTHRDHSGYWASILHRISGLALAIFLPVHFYVLALALEGAGSLDGFLRFADMPAAKIGEWGLVLLLTLHVCLGLRVLAIELLPASPTGTTRLSWIRWGGVISIGVGIAFLARAF
jgi:fumarate reductase subunit D